MNKKRRLIIVIILILVVVAGVYFLLPKNTKIETPQNIKMEDTAQVGLVENSTVDTSSIDTSEIIKTELYATGNNKNIYGYITAPKNYAEHKLPTIIMAHGFGGLAERSDYYAQNLAKEGYVVYSFDFMGGNINSRSGNDILAMSVFTEMDDLDVVVKMLQSQDYVDTNNIFVLGQSQGGVVAVMEAAKVKNEIKGLILIFPAFVLFDDARDIFKSVDEIPAVYNHRGNNVGRVYFEKSLDYDIFEDMKTYEGNVLMVHGDNDRIAPISYSERALTTFKNATLKTISGAGHGFNAQQQVETQNAINDFLKQTIQK